MTDLNIIIYVAASVFIASFFFAITGFTLSLVAVPLLMPVLGAKETVVFIIFGTFLAKVAALWNTRRDFEWRTVLVTVAGSFLGSLPGSYVLNIIQPACLQVLLGIMLLATLFFMGRQFKINIKNQTAGRITAGFISGFSAAVTSISGPPVALYFLAEGRGKIVTRANMCWIFAFGSIGTMISLVAAGNFISTDLMKLAFYAALPLLLGMWLGERCFHKINQSLFVRLTRIFVVFGACTALYRGITALLQL